MFSATQGLLCLHKLCCAANAGVVVSFGNARGVLTSEAESPLLPAYTEAIDWSFCMWFSSLAIRLSVPIYSVYSCASRTD